VRYLRKVAKGDDSNLTLTTPARSGVHTPGVSAEMLTRCF
jgi:hypothetical protein